MPEPVRKSQHRIDAERRLELASERLRLALERGAQQDLGPMQRAIATGNLPAMKAEMDRLGDGDGDLLAAIDEYKAAGDLLPFAIAADLFDPPTDN